MGKCTNFFAWIKIFKTIDNHSKSLYNSRDSIKSQTDKVYEMLDLPEVVTNYTRYLSVVKGRTPQTVAKYEDDLYLFLRHVLAVRKNISPESEEYKNLDITGIDIGFIKSVSYEDILEFLYHKRSFDNNHSKAIARRISAIKSFYKYYTVTVHELDENPAINIETPQHSKKLPKFLSLDECTLLLDVIATDGESKTRIRDYAIVTLFLNTGIRLSELTGINLTDIDRDFRTMNVRGKGSKERLIYLNEACRSALRDYYSVRLSDPDVKFEDRNAFFVSSHHRRISNQTVQKMVEKYLAAAGLASKGYSVHKLRHTAATLMYRSGEVDVRVLKDILGHEQLNTTQIYTHVSDAQMEKAMQSNPLSSVNIKK